MAKGKKEDRLVITDPLMDPYEIRVDSSQNYVVNDVTKSAPMQAQGYHNNVPSALKHIIQLKMIHGGGSFTLSEYLREVKRVHDELSKVVNQFQVC